MLGVAGARLEWRRFDIQPGRSIRHAVCAPGEVTTGVGQVFLASSSQPVLLGDGRHDRCFRLGDDPRSFLWAPSSPEDPVGPPVGWTWFFDNDRGADWPVLVYFICLPGG